MEVFGPHWTNYEERIMDHWKKIIHDDDLVLIPGDISWAMDESEAYHDLIRIENLPGKKVLLKGNHDYWWSSLKKLSKFEFKTIFFLQNNSFEYGDFVIAGTRGWTDTKTKDFTPLDQKVFDRELIRLELSLKSANNEKEIICLLHYPPFSDNLLPNEYGDLMEKYNVRTCIYGHLHGDGLQNVIEGSYNGIDYLCTSSDYLSFIPKKIRE